MTRPTVLVTRPEPGAGSTAALLEDAGYEPLICPLSEIAPLNTGIVPGDLSAFDAVAVTSANAIRHLPPKLLDAIRSKPIFAVGEATADAAAEAGFADIHVSEGDAVALAGLVDAQTDPGSRVAYLTGRVRTGTFEEAMTQRQRNFSIIETYSTEKVSYTTYKNEIAGHAGPIHAVLLHSAFSVRALLAFGAEYGGFQPYENAALILISRRVLAEVPESWRDRCSVAEAPTDAAMLARLKQVLPA